MRIEQTRLELRIDLADADIRVNHISPHRQYDYRPTSLVAHFNRPSGAWLLAAVVLYGPIIRKKDGSQSEVQTMEEWRVPDNIVECPDWALDMVRELI